MTDQRVPSQGAPRSAGPPSAPRGVGSASDDRRSSRGLPGPRVGWISYLAIIAMAVIVGLAIDDARWAGVNPADPDRSQTWFFPLAAAISATIGLVLGSSRVRTIPAHLVGATSGVAMVLLSASMSISASLPLQLQLRRLADSVATFYQDLVILGIRSAETSVFLITLGGVVWATAYFASFMAFRRRQPVPGILLMGLLLVVNQAVTIRDQLPYMIVFAAAALVLVVRVNLSRQQEGWHERQVVDLNGASRLVLLSGVAAVVIAVVGSSVLAIGASSAPLASMWRQMDDQVTRVGSEINRLVGGVTGPVRGPAGLFSSSQTIQGVWESSPDIVFQAATSDGQGYYWRGATYDSFDGATWHQLDREGSQVPAAADLLELMRDGTLDPARRQGVNVRFTPVDYVGRTVLAPEALLAVDQPTELITHETDGPFATAEFVDPLDEGEAYVVSSLVPAETIADGAITGNELAAAGVRYPAWAERYVELLPNSIGQRTEATAARIVARLPEARRNPYHIAQAIQNHLYSTGGFRYQTDVRGLCSGERLVECFLRTKVGYCEHFATAMVMLLRTQQIPARMVMGYLPGTQLSDGTFEVARSAAHAWVEVYFPGYGWIRFDPTPGNQANGQEPTRLRAGPPVASPTPDGNGEDPIEVPEFGSFAPDEIDGEEPDDPSASLEPGVGAAGTSGPDGGATSAVVLIVLVVIAGALIVLARRQRPSSVGPEVAYGRITQLAGRLGYAPEPSQTVYEYATVLGERVPEIRHDLQVVADAKVAATYGRQEPSGGLLARLQDASRRIRVGLLRAVVRRWTRRQ